MDCIGTGREIVMLLWSLGLAILLSSQFEKCEAQNTGFCDQLVLPRGYSCEEHKIYTEDGFGLLLHKIGIIQSSRKAASQKGEVSTLNLHKAAVPTASPVPKLSLESTSGKVSQALHPAEMNNSSQSYESAMDDYLKAYQRPYQSIGDYPKPFKGWRSDDSRTAPQNIPVTFPLPTFESNEGPYEGLPADDSPPLILDPIPFDPATPPPSPPPPKESPLFPPLPAQPFISQPPHQVASDRASPPTDKPWSTTSNAAPAPAMAPARPPISMSAQDPSQRGGETSLPTTEPVTHNFPDSGRSVLLLHPELLNGDSWFKNADMFGQISTPLLPFALADAGFDVWIGHERATYWSHDHLKLNTASHEYWNWSWDELARFDVPAMLGYIRDTAQSRVHLVGVSESARVATAAATQVGVAMLMKSLVLIGPNVYRGNEASTMLESWARLLVLTMNEPELTPNSGQFNISREFAVSDVTLTGPASIVSGPDCCIHSRITLFDNGWDGITSYKNIEHIQQAFFGNNFRHFDYGNSSRNMAAYGQETPPSYSPEQIMTDLPVLVIYGGQDQFSPPEAIEELFVKMQKEPLKVYLAAYAHFDLFFSSSRHQDIYAPIRSFLQSVLTETSETPAGPAQAIAMNETAVSGQAAPQPAV